MRTTKMLLLGLALTASVSAYAQPPGAGGDPNPSQSAYENANCNAAFLRNTPACTGTETVVGSSGAGAPLGVLGQSPLELALLGVVAITAARSIKKRKRK